MKTKNKVFSAIGVVAFAIAVAFNMNVNAKLNGNSDMDIALDNVEALAQGEGTSVCSKICVYTSNNVCYFEYPMACLGQRVLIA